MAWSQNEERTFFAENLNDEDLAPKIAEAETPPAVCLLLEEGLTLSSGVCAQALLLKPPLKRFKPLTLRQLAPIDTNIR